MTASIAAARKTGAADGLRRQSGKADPSNIARIAGTLYLLTFGTLFGEFIRSRMIVPGDPTATANNIMISETLFRFGFAADLISAMAYIGVAVLLYYLLEPVGKTLSMLAAAFSLAGSVAMAVGLLHHMGALLILKGGGFTGAGQEYLQSLATVSLRLHAVAFAIAMAFFGLYCLLLGVLIIRSHFLPKPIGALLALTGPCYLINSFARFLNPALAADLSPWILMPGLMGEGGLVLWLIVKGVDNKAWHEQSGLRRGPSSDTLGR